MIAVGLLVAGYLALVVEFGWGGLLVTAVHIGIMLLARR